MVVVVNKLIISVGMGITYLVSTPFLGDANELEEIEEDPDPLIIDESVHVPEEASLHPSERPSKPVEVEEVVEAPKEVEEVEPNTEEQEQVEPQRVEEPTQEEEAPKQEREEVLQESTGAEQEGQTPEQEPTIPTDTSDSSDSDDSNHSSGSFEVTYYTAFCDTGCTGVTATGLDVSNSTSHNGHGIIATDPSVIPMGTVVEIDGSTYVAQDTGGNIQGNRIDILVSSKEEAVNNGRHSSNVTIQ